MSNSITKQSFVQNLAGQSIDVARAKSDARVRDVDVAAADLDKDGKISGDKEMGALFSELDKFDRDGSRSSIKSDSARLQAMTELRSGFVGPPAPSSAAGPKRGLQKNDDVMFVGLNSTSAPELAALRKGGATVNEVQGSKRPDTAVVDGKRVDLSSAEGARAFAASLGLPKNVAADVAKAIENGSPGGRDELAGIAKVWAGAYRGEAIPSRVVVSGNADFFRVMGDHGSLTPSSLGALAKAMPAASQQIEDLHVAASNMGHSSNITQWREALPSLTSIHAFAGDAPLAGKGSEDVLARWEQSTRGDETLSAVKKPGGSSESVWTRDGGFVGPQAKTAKEAKEARDISELPFFEALYQGKDVPREQLRAHYNNVVAMLNAGGLSAEQTKDLQKEQQQALFLLHPRGYAIGFQQQFGAEVRAGFSSFGLGGEKQPDLSTMSRRDTLAMIERLSQKLIDMPAPRPDAAVKLMNLLEKHLGQMEPWW